MIERLLAPDQHRVFIGEVAVYPTRDVPIECVRRVEATYRVLGHPVGSNVNKWKEAIGLPVDIDDSAVCVFCVLFCSLLLPLLLTLLFES